MAKSAFTDGFYQCCETTRVHFMVLGRVNRTTLGSKLLLTAVWASLVDFISSCHLLKPRHYSLSPNWCFTPPSAPHPPPPPTPPPSHPPTIYFKLTFLKIQNAQRWSVFPKMVTYSHWCIHMISLLITLILSFALDSTCTNKESWDITIAYQYTDNYNITTYVVRYCMYKYFLLILHT